MWDKAIETLRTEPDVKDRVAGAEKEIRFRKNLKRGANESETRALQERRAARKAPLQRALHRIKAANGSFAFDSLPASSPIQIPLLVQVFLRMFQIRSWFVQQIKEYP